MNRGIQRFIPIIFLTLIVVLVIAAIFSVARIFLNGTQQPSDQTVDTSSEQLLDTSAGSSVRMTLRGPIVADENFRTYQVTVTPSERKFVRYKGYLVSPIVSKSQGNNVKAYDEFVHALSRANMSRGTALTGDADDTRGVCANGILYEFEIISDDSVVERLWTTTCRGAGGSLVANADQLRELFLAQVPNAVQYIGRD